MRHCDDAEIKDERQETEAVARLVSVSTGCFAIMDEDSKDDRSAAMPNIHCSWQDLSSKLPTYLRYPYLFSDGSSLT